MTRLPAGADGSMSAATVREALQSRDDVALVSVMWANYELSTITHRRISGRHRQIRRLHAHNAVQAEVVRENPNALGDVAEEIDLPTTAQPGNGG